LGDVQLLNFGFACFFFTSAHWKWIAFDFPTPVALNLNVAVFVAWLMSASEIFVFGRPSLNVAAIA
jgi:hypothetical protein